MCHFNKGKVENIAFLFSCPGKMEEDCGKPVAGKTGEHLDTLIRLLNDDEIGKKYFTSDKRYDYRITNAYSRVLYNGKDGRSEPRASEIKPPENIRRLKAELRGFSIVILFGKKAQKAYEMLGIEKHTKKITAIHLGSRGLSRIHVDESVPKGERTQKRLEIVAERISKQLQAFEAYTWGDPGT